MQIEQVLKELGLGKNKASVYLATLELGKGTAQEVGLKVGLPRTTVHEIMQQLLGLGLVSLTTKGRTRTYIAEEPLKLKRILQERQKKLEMILPELNLLMNTRAEKPRVRYYQGIEGVKTVFEDTLTTSTKTLHCIFSVEDTYKVPGQKFIDDYVKQRIAAGIQLNVIRSEIKDVAQNFPASHEELRELRYAPKNMVFAMTVYLYDNKVAVISTSRENYGMIIESADFHQTIRNMFDLVWEVSRIVHEE